MTYNLNSCPTWFLWWLKRCCVRICIFLIVHEFRMPFLAKYLEMFCSVSVTIVVGYSPVLSRSSFWSCGQLSYQVTRLREYQGVDPHFDTIARQYHDIVKVTPVCILPLLLKILSLISCRPRPAEIGKHAMDNPSSWNGPETVTRSSKSLNWIYFLTS